MLATPHLSQMQGSLSEGRPSRLSEHWLCVAWRLFEILKSFFSGLEVEERGEKKKSVWRKVFCTMLALFGSQQTSARQGESTLKYWRGEREGGLWALVNLKDACYWACLFFFCVWMCTCSSQQERLWRGLHLPWEMRGSPGHDSPQQSSPAWAESPWLYSRKTEPACAAEEEIKQQQTKKPHTHTHIFNEIPVSCWACYVCSVMLH